MFVHKRRGWEIPESRVTPESLSLGRRALIAGAAGIAAGGIAGPALADPNPKFPAGRAITPEADSTTYNNYYEFGDDKGIWRAAQRLPVSPWEVEISGMVAKPGKMDISDLIKAMPVEERIYRHRCVETWAMTVPWTGFALPNLVAMAQPTSDAKYVVFQTYTNPRVMPGLRASYYPWPYTEGLTLQEANNDLAFMVTGMYGKDLPKQDGAPLRLATPWKYGFKSIKSINKIMFTDKRPATFWEALQSSEYGFWANINPAVPHPRWSQASERLLGSGDRVPTQIWNGYGDFVASMYADKQSERLFA